MKKRVKLLTTIASLCLAVALMAFGVYAATNPSFVATGSLSFTATGIDGTWDITSVTVEGGTFAGGVTTMDVTSLDETSDVSIDAVTVGTTGTATVTIVVKYTPTSGSDAANLDATGIKTSGDDVLSFVNASEANVTAEKSLTVSVTLTTNTYTSATAGYKFTFAATQA